MKLHPFSRVVALLLLIVTFSVGGCSHNRKSDQARLDSERMVTVTIDDDAAPQSAATVRVGQLLVVRLPAQAGTGYSWRLVSEAAADSVLGLAQHRTEHELKPDGKPLPGGRTWDTFSLPASRQGTATLEFVYDRPWERNASPAKRHTVKVDVEQ